MEAINSASHPVSPNRRRRVRHKIQTPAYATFTAESKGAMLDLHEIVDISEDGIAIQCHSPLALERRVSLCLDLADCPEHIYTTGEVVWCNALGRAGLHFSELSSESVSRLREWLFVNVMAGVANGESEISGVAISPPEPVLRPNYTDTLAAVSAVRRQVEALGPGLFAALQLIADRAQTLLRASGAAIAIAEEEDSDFMVCRASSGPDAPPVGARLQVGSGFSGRCVKTGLPLRCDDSELDDLVDRESCRALGIRSILAAPVHDGENSIGIVEVFAREPNTFSESDTELLQHFAETVLAAVNRAARAEDLPELGTRSPAEQFAPMPGSVLFASLPDSVVDAEDKHEDKHEDTRETPSSSITLPRSPLIILVVALALTFMALGFNMAPWIQSKLKERGHGSMQTVLASSPTSKSEAPALDNTPALAIETASFAQLRQMAEEGDAAAENALGLRYFQGDEKNHIARDEQQAFRWFRSAADHGSLAAQAKLGALYWGGRGVTKDVSQAYFWTVLARARGDKENKDLAAILSSGMTRSQAALVEQQADTWLQQHMPNWKPAAGR